MTFVIISAGIYRELFTSEPLTGDDVIQHRGQVTSDPWMHHKLEQWLADPKGPTLMRMSHDVIVVRVEK